MGQVSAVVSAASDKKEEVSMESQVNSFPWYPCVLSTTQWRTPTLAMTSSQSDYTVTQRYTLALRDKRYTSALRDKRYTLALRDDKELQYVLW